jgi:predicted PurR-regulated permease PerM
VRVAEATGGAVVAGGSEASAPASVSPPRRARRVAIRHLATLAGWAVAIFLVFHFFPAFELVLLCLLGSAILAAALRPLAQRVPAKRWPSAVMVGLLLMIAVVGLFWLLGWLVWDVVHEQAGQWPRIQGQIDEMLAGWSKSLGLGNALSLAALRDRMADALTGSGGRGGGGEGMMAAAAAIANGVVALVLVLFGAMFLLGERERQLLGPLIAFLPARRRSQVTGALSDLEPKLRWWLLGTLCSMLVTGLASGIGFGLAGLSFAVALGVLAGLSEMIPTFGPTMAFGIALLVAATEGRGSVLKVLVVWLVVQTLESYIVLPLVMKRAVSLPPLVTLFSIVFWGKVFGIAGLLLAIPLDLVIWAFARHLLGRGGSDPGRLPADVATATAASS